MRKIVCALVFMGSLWQLEIADLCIYNGWTFGYLFSLLKFSNLWGVRDFWMLLMVVAFLIAVAPSYREMKEQYEKWK